MSTTTRPEITTPPHLMQAAALRRIDALTARYGADSPQVAQALMRWAAITAAHEPVQQHPESLEAVLAGIADDEHVTVTGLDDAAYAAAAVGRAVPVTTLRDAEPVYVFDGSRSSEVVVIHPDVFSRPPRRFPARRPAAH
ncbi:MAG: hypothetical protein NVV66_18455 [Cellulomonas sp.]|uniref:hypothetical protein n=1 Tax=Cellulomonas sp. TaxID=40001 RepID=UPI00258519A3|nr:hypothetical protein [Cellulomonas sp.]MCR6706580.1 hypothetical protein [Cellulomonas sp.]